MLHGADLLLQTRKVRAFGVVGLEVLHGLNALLDAVGAGLRLHVLNGNCG